MRSGPVQDINRLTEHPKIQPKSESTKHVLLIKHKLIVHIETRRGPIEWHFQWKTKSRCILSGAGNDINKFDAPELNLHKITTRIRHEIC